MDMNENTQKPKKQGKLVYYIVGITVIIVAALTSLQIFVVTNRTKLSVASDYEENCLKITDAYSNVVSMKLSEYIKQMRMYTEADVTQTENPVEIQEWLVEHAKSRTPDFDRIGYIDQKGDFYNDQNKITNVKDRIYFKAIMEQGNDTNIDDPVTSKSTGTTIIHVSQAAKVNGRTVGFYSAVVGVDKLTEFVRTIKIGKTGYAILFNSEGDIISTSAPNSDEAGLKAIIESMTTITQALAQKQSGATWIKSKTLGTKFVTYQPVENADWGFAFMIDDSQPSFLCHSFYSDRFFSNIILFKQNINFFDRCFDFEKRFEGMENSCTDSKQKCDCKNHACNNQRDCDFLCRSINLAVINKECKTPVRIFNRFIGDEFCSKLTGFNPDGTALIL